MGERGGGEIGFQKRETEYISKLRSVNTKKVAMRMDMKIRSQVDKTIVTKSSSLGLCTAY